MVKMSDFIVFEVVISLLWEIGCLVIIDEVYCKLKVQEFLLKEEIVNYVCEIYVLFKLEEIFDKIV